MASFSLTALGFLPEPGGYLHRMAYLLCSVPLVAAGVMMYLSPNILPTPGDGMSLAISKSTGKSLPASKTIFDCTVPYAMKDRFVRARFMDVDPKHWVDE